MYEIADGINNMRLKFGLIWCFVLIYVAQSQDADSLIEKIYQQNLKQEAILAQMGDYKFKQIVNFTKLDSDDEIDEKSYREFEIFVRSPEKKKRILLSAREFEDGQWHVALSSVIYLYL